MKTRNKKTIIRLLMIFICAVSLQGMLGCDSTTSKDGDGSGSGSGGSLSDDYELGSGEVDGIEGTLEDEDVSISKSSIESTVQIIELGSTNPNNIYDENDNGISISVSNDFGGEQARFSVSISTYIAYQENEIYKFDSSNFDEWIVHLGYCSSNCNDDSSWKSYTEESFNLVFFQVPTTVGEDVSGEMEVIIDDGSILIAEFNAQLESYVFQYQ